MYPLIQVPTSLSNHNIVGIKLGYNALANQDKASPKTFENLSFQSLLDIYQGDMIALNSSLAEIDWQALFDHCNTENDDLNENNEFAELLRLTVLQLCNIHCPKKASIVAKTSTNRNISVLHRKRRKMKTSLHCLQNHQPHSSTIPYLQEQLSLLQLSIRDSITEELSKREQKAVDTIKSNPRYFYSYAKRLSKLRSNVGPLKDENGSLQHQPKTMADILQT